MAAGLRRIGVALIVMIVAGCGGSAASSPGDAVTAYLTALADNDGQKACDLLTIEARAELVEGTGTSDCPVLVERFHQFVGGDADRLKEADLSNGSGEADTTTVTATLEGRSVDVALEKVAGEWRIASGRVASELLGIPNPGD